MGNYSSLVVVTVSVHLMSMFQVIHSRTIDSLEGYAFFATVQCEPLGGDSIHMPLVPREKKNFNYTNGSVTIVAARMDTSSLFANLGPGGDSVVTGLVTWMITAHLLSQEAFYSGLNSSNESIHFMLFNGVH